ncbi:Malonyl CoA-acyl carrier protein transacylase [Klebsiella pneumoniae IS39]|nr:Malonyl CoA-acyl carrier protein transacylase [Klebsiella pneumoniae IS39]
MRGRIGFADAVRLVELRGKFMQEAVPEGTGAMSAIIGLDDAAIAKACEESAEGQVVSPVNYNSPGQVVIAGHKEAVDARAPPVKPPAPKRRAAAAGERAVPLRADEASRRKTGGRAAENHLQRADDSGGE